MGLIIVRILRRVAIRAIRKNRSLVASEQDELDFLGAESAEFFERGEHAGAGGPDVVEK